MATLTVYPDPNPETTSVDGQVGHKNALGASWATFTGGVGTSNAGNSDSGNTWEAFYWLTNTTSNNWEELDRGIVLFDTSALTADATISAAVLSLYITAKADPRSNTPNINIYTSAPASNTAVAFGDFDSLGSTELSTSIAYGSVSTSAYNDFVLNASGLAAISKTSITKLGTRNPNKDVANSAPTWGAGGEETYIRCSAAEVADTSQDPKLVITYTVPVAHEKTVTDTTTTTTSIIRATTKVFSSTITMTAINQVIRVFSKTVTDTITTTTSLVRSVTKVISNTLTTTASVAKGLTRTLSNTITSTASVLKGPTKVVLDTITSTAGLRQLSLFLNGVIQDLIWTRQSKNSASWTNQTKNSSTWTNQDKS